MKGKTKTRSYRPFDVSRCGSACKVVKDKQIAIAIQFFLIFSPSPPFKLLSIVLGIFFFKLKLQMIENVGFLSMGC